ncbi:MAG: aminotransferase class IV [Clostridia bacterium]|nr:aminotransferase class IV [Clostridia bacterium]
MQDIVGNYYVLNNSVDTLKEDFTIDYEKSTFYEVIRIIDGVPLFFEEHYNRLKNSMNILDLNLKCSKQELKSSIKKLIEVYGSPDCNVKINIYDSEGEQNCLLYISKSYYPPKEEVEKGIGVSLLKLERNNPNVKIINTSYKEAVSKKMNETGAFEILLVNEDGKVTEGSKSNVFFVRGTKVFTSPGEYVLKGITRQYIIDVCKRLELEVVETLIDIVSLSEMEGLFISGTSIKVLPVSTVDSFVFSSGSHPTIIDIRDQFDKFIDDYVSRNRE